MQRAAPASGGTQTSPPAQPLPSAALQDTAFIENDAGGSVGVPPDGVQFPGTVKPAMEKFVSVGREFTCMHVSVTVKGSLMLAAMHEPGSVKPSTVSDVGHVPFGFPQSHGPHVVGSALGDPTPPTTSA